MRKRFFALIVVVVALGLMVPGVLATGHLLAPFTQSELDNNWEADRYFPTGGVTSVSAFGRDDVARIGIDSDEASTNSFQWYEGIKTISEINDDFGQAVQIDLYLDPTWGDTAVNAGLWVAGDNGAGARDSFAILEFVNNGAHLDFRIWDGVGAWDYLDADIEFGEWVTLSIILDTVELDYTYAIDGIDVGTAPAGVTTSHIRELFLNSANYGARPPEDYPNLNNDSYAAHWHNGDVPPAPQPESKNDCKKGGWADFGFKNQGQCIASVQSNENSRHNR